jgi:hypothetical protein
VVKKVENAVFVPAWVSRAWPVGATNTIEHGGLDTPTADPRQAIRPSEIKVDTHFPPVTLARMKQSSDTTLNLRGLEPKLVSQVKHAAVERRMTLKDFAVQCLRDGLAIQGMKGVLPSDVRRNWKTQSSGSESNSVLAGEHGVAEGTSADQTSELQKKADQIVLEAAKEAVRETMLPTHDARCTCGVCQAAKKVKR